MPVRLPVRMRIYLSKKDKPEYLIINQGDAYNLGCSEVLFS